MAYKITIEGESVWEIYNELAKFCRLDTTPVATPTEQFHEIVKKSKKGKSAPVEVPAIIALEKEEVSEGDSVQPQGDSGVVLTPVKSPSPDSQVESPTPALDYDAVKRVTLALIKAKGKEKALDVLGEFGCKAATELKPEKYAEFIASAQAAIARL